MNLQSAGGGKSLKLSALRSVYNQAVPISDHLMALVLYAG